MIDEEAIELQKIIYEEASVRGLPSYAESAKHAISAIEGRHILAIEVEHLRDKCKLMEEESKTLALIRRAVKKHHENSIGKWTSPDAISCAVSLWEGFGDTSALKKLSGESDEHSE
jgi:hypothetical protein